MIRRPPRSTQSRSSAASDVYKRQGLPAGCSRGRSVDKEVHKPVGLALPFGELAEKSKVLVTIAGAGDVNFGDGVTPYISSGGVDYPWESASAVFTLSLIHISEPTRLGMISYAVFCLKKKKL